MSDDDSGENILTRLEARTFDGRISVRATALLYLLGVIDGLLKADADTAAMVELLIGTEKP